MKYFVTIGAQTIEVEVDGDRVLVGGEAVDAHLAPLPGTPLYHLLLGGESWTVAAQPLEGDGQWAMGVVGERMEVAVQDEQSRETDDDVQAPAEQHVNHDLNAEVVDPFGSAAEAGDEDRGRRIEHDEGDHRWSDEAFWKGAQSRGEH